jgi:hypothetical protein
MTNTPDGPASNPDPEPDGRTQPTSGDVQPGETPPASDQVSAPQGHDEHGPRSATPWLWLGAIGLVVVLAALLFIGLLVRLIN